MQSIGMIHINKKDKRMKNALFISFLLIFAKSHASQEPLRTPRIAKEQPRPNAYMEYTPEQQASRIQPILVIPPNIEPNNLSVDPNDWYVPVVAPGARARELYTRPAMSR